MGRNSEDVKLARREFVEWQVQAHGSNEEIIYIDESGFNLWLARTRGRVRVLGSGRKSSWRKERTQFHVHHCNLQHCEFRAGGTRIDHFNNFLTRASESTKNVAATFVLDNAPSHRRARNVGIGNNGIRFYQPTAQC